MTTPERLRRRQRIETFLVAVTIVLTVASGIYSNRQNDKQNECMAQQFHDLSVTLSARAALTQRESNATAEVLSTAAATQDDKQIAAALRKYDRTVKQIYKERAENPLPKFPTGRCESSGSKPSVLPGQGFRGVNGLGVLNPPRLDGVEDVDVYRTAIAVRRSVGDGVDDHERDTDSDAGGPSGGHSGGSGDGGGGSDPGGGGGQPVGGPALNVPVERVVAPVTETVERATEAVTVPVVAAVAGG